MKYSGLWAFPIIANITSNSKNGGRKSPYSHIFKFDLSHRITYALDSDTIYI